jgi:triphosphoribosyl-dephospho-CoA synthetase
VDAVYAHAFEASSLAVRTMGAAAVEASDAARLELVRDLVLKHARRHARAVMVSLNLLEAMLGPPATTAAEDEAWLRDQPAALRFDDSGGA